MTVMLGNFIATHRRNDISSERKANVSKAFCSGAAGLLSVCSLELRRNKIGNVN